MAALLELGAGFHGDLTGRENVYLNGSILGLHQGRGRRRSSTTSSTSPSSRHFIDIQVKHYSSGMYARLGFAVAINVEPDILLIDEVLSVGDEAFQRKCLERIKQFQREGRTILVVTHAADLVRQICDRAAVLDHGHLVDIATPGEAIRTFRESLARRGIATARRFAPRTAASAAAPSGEAGSRPSWSGPPSGSIPAITVDKTVQITGIRVEYPEPKARFLLPDAADAGAHRLLRALSGWTTSRSRCRLTTRTETLVIATDTQTLGMPVHAVEGVGVLCFDMERVPLLDGAYLLTIVALDPRWRNDVGPP